MPDYLRTHVQVEDVDYVKQELSLLCFFDKTDDRAGSVNIIAWYDHDRQCGLSHIVTDEGDLLSDHLPPELIEPMLDRCRIIFDLDRFVEDYLSDVDRDEGKIFRSPSRPTGTPSPRNVAWNATKGGTLDCLTDDQTQPASSTRPPSISSSSSTSWSRSSHRAPPIETTMTSNTDILGTDELARPITVKQMNDTDGLIPRLKLISEIISPTQRYVQDCLRLAECQAHNLEHYRKQAIDVRNSLLALLKSDINNLISDELDRRSDSLVTMDEVRDCLSDELVDHIQNNRRFRTEVSEIASSCIDTSDIKEDIQSEIERDLSDKISDAIDDHDFGDILDDHTRDLDEKIVNRLASEIEDDSSHSLVNAIARAIALRLNTASK